MPHLSVRSARVTYPQPLLLLRISFSQEVRRHLPEFHHYVQRLPEIAGTLTRKEAGYISEILTLAALQAGKNVIVDGSLRDSKWYTAYFSQLRANYTNLKIAILHIVAPREVVFQRAIVSTGIICDDECQLRFPILICVSLHDALC